MSNKYVVEVEGRDVLTHFDIDGFDPNEPFGFLTTRYVLADTAELAADAAMLSVNQELRSMGVSTLEGGPLVMWINEVEQVETFPADVTPPGSGFGWFPQRSDAE